MLISGGNEKQEVFMKKAIIAILFLILVTIPCVQALTIENVLQPGFFSSTGRFYITPDSVFDSKESAKYGNHDKKTYKDVFITTSKATDIFQKRYYDQKEKQTFTFKRKVIKESRTRYVLTTKRGSGNTKIITTLKTPSEEQKRTFSRKTRSAFDYKTYSNHSVQSNNIFKTTQIYKRKASGSGLLPTKPFNAEWLEAWMQTNGGEIYNVSKTEDKKISGNCATITGTKIITGYLHSGSGFVFDLSVRLERSYRADYELDDNVLNINYVLEEKSKDVKYASRQVKICYSAVLNPDGSVISEKEKVNIKADEGFTREYMNFLYSDGKDYGGLPGWTGKSSGRDLEKNETDMVFSKVEPNLLK